MLNNPDVTGVEYSAILDDRVTLNSSFSELNEPEMESLANALVESLKEE
ncbi:MAG: hypothetical protein FWG09_07200 [Synergistaceae bacterium]|nr:hypothetical protein [Synergistaceae bacterium]